MNRIVCTEENRPNQNFVPEETLHEKQSLQLCAVHAVNNLLQISHDADARVDIMEHDGSYVSSDEKVSQDDGFFMLCAGNVYRCNQNLRMRANKKEFDDIADELHQKEIHLLSQDPTRVPWTRFLRMSNHRSLFTGNYSFEVSHRIGGYLRHSNGHLYFYISMKYVS